jgi:transcriptional regulator with GAF, ATPase, and Fis domain
MNDERRRPEVAPIAEEAVTQQQARLAEMFVTLADTLIEDYDVVDLLDQLVRTCVDLLGAAAAGLLLIDQRGSLQVMASSSEAAQILELLQLQNDEGPCLDCVRTGRPVIVADMTADAGRWPQFAAAALAAGFHAVDALPLRLRTEVIGGLNVFHAEPEPFNDYDRRVVAALGATATIGILQQRALHRSSVLGEQLQTALNSRVVIEQAKGMLAEHAKVGMDEAFALLRRHARNNNRKLTDVARAVTDDGLRLDTSD